jgi:hypothetical protein
VGGIRVQSMNADRAIARLVGRVLGRGLGESAGAPDRTEPREPS